MPPTWLPLVLCTIGLAAVALRSWRLRRSGVNPWVLASGDDAHGFLGRCYFWLIGSAFFVLLTWAFAPGWSVRFFGALPLLIHPVVAWTGIALDIIGIGLIVLAQREMGRAWRVGIPARERPALVTTGPFRFSRNPVFLGIVFTATGVALAIPHALSVAVLAAVYVALSVQIRLEEAYLEGWLGVDYASYATRTGRWLSLPWEPCRAGSRPLE
ncbi:MAG TPA: isoprenylcysteine carboxylmethyltransferase family protein [Microvirga sp.]|nr:isoprenylcysteine carboxylmethyltransferase family protein [Microvirga sp.]